MANEKRLIDANALIDRLKFKWRVSEFGLHRGLESAIAQCNKALTVDAVEVVRCKDCKHYYFSERCSLLGQWPEEPEMDKDDFCSYGERRTDNERKAD